MAKVSEKCAIWFYGYMKKNVLSGMATKGLSQLSFL